MKEENDFLKQIQEEVNKHIRDSNFTSLPEIDNLSPYDMELILYDTFDESSPIGFSNKIGKKVLAQIPFISLVYDFLMVVKESKSIKLTSRGNLPRQLCLDLYLKGYIKEYFIENGITKLSKEGDSIVLQNMKIVSELSGLIKKRKNVLSLTKKGNLILDQRNKEKLLRELFVANCKKFNLGYHDGYPDEVNCNLIFGYTLYLLLQYGGKEKRLDFYVEKNLSAFPLLLDFFQAGYRSREEQFSSCYGLRVFERFLTYYGFIACEDFKTLDTSNIPIQTTDIFREVFTLKRKNFKFRKSDYNA